MSPEVAVAILAACLLLNGAALSYGLSERRRLSRWAFTPTEAMKANRNFLIFYSICFVLIASGIGRVIAA